MRLCKDSTATVVLTCGTSFLYLNTIARGVVQEELVAATIGVCDASVRNLLALKFGARVVHALHLQGKVLLFIGYEVGYFHEVKFVRSHLQPAPTNRHFGSIKGGKTKAINVKSQRFFK